MPRAVERQPKVIAVDTETTGKDFWHGARPFFVTVAEVVDGEVINSAWRWDVDPLTRQVLIPSEELDQIEQRLDDADVLWFQNPKFDFHALEKAGISMERFWPKVMDTLTAGHLLGSNMPHDLTSMAGRWLGKDIQPFEEQMRRVIQECRRWCRTRLTDWRIARHGDPSMPSCPKSSKNKKERGEDQDNSWKFDMWLAHALAKELRKPEDHPWWTVTASYSNIDSATTLLLGPVMLTEIRRRKLEAIYRERLRCLPVAWRMEDDGVTVNRDRMTSIKRQCDEEALGHGKRMVEIAAEYNWDLELPKGSSVNRSLSAFCFSVLELQPIRNPKGKTDAPSLDGKNAIPFYLDTLPEGSNEREFIQRLSAKRAADTYSGYVAQYQRYALPLLEGWHDDGSVEGVPSYAENWLVLHTNINSTGSDTLRWSHTNPNSANVSTKEMDDADEEGLKTSLRSIFGPAPGREWWCADAENIELRIPAYESGEQALIDLFERKDEPPFWGKEHLLNFSVVYQDIWEAEMRVHGPLKVGEVIQTKHKPLYKRCKNGAFAMGYGAVDKADGTGTADRSFGRPGSQAKLRSRFANKEKLNQRYISLANRNGWVETMPDKSVDPERGYPLLCSRNERGGIKPTVPLNYHVQSTAMWWTTKAMVRCSFLLGEWRAKGFDGKLILQVHDELVFDFPAGGHPVKDRKRSNLWRAKELKRLMELGGDDISVPTPVALKWCPVSWADGIAVQ